jgi:hypothetical protein
MRAKPAVIFMRLFIKNKIITRYFNDFIDHGDYYEKRSIQKDKLYQEYNFFLNLPAEIAFYYPEVHSFKETEKFSSYWIRKIPVVDTSFLLIDPTENDLLVQSLILKVDKYLLSLPHHLVSAEEFKESVSREILQKNLERLELIQKLPSASELNIICHQFGYRDLAEYIHHLNSSIEINVLKEQRYTLYLSHGDMCFSNMLIQNDKLYLIDPKGSENPEHNFRPPHYELAKISQCLHGHYDLLNHEMFSIEDNNKINIQGLKNLPLTEKSFKSILHRMGTNLKTIRLVEASLFVSMLPFHQDSEKKLKGFLINSLLISSENL